MEDFETDYQRKNNNLRQILSMKDEVKRTKIEEQIKKNRKNINKEKNGRVSEKGPGCMAICNEFCIARVWNAVLKTKP